MRKTVIFIGLITIAAGLTACTAWGNSLSYLNKSIKIKKIKKVIYFTPEVIPDIPDIIYPTDFAFYSAASDFMKDREKIKILRIGQSINYDTVDVESIREFCQNNDAEVALIPRVKYFKVGLGKYVFSNQVVVSAKLYDAEGNFIIETAYNTYKGNGRLLGSAENSVKIGTKGMLKQMDKEIRKYKLGTP